MKKFFPKAISPEQVGIPSGRIQKMIRLLDDNGLTMHSILLLRHGEVAAEGYWAPYTESSLHRMYSTTKSFVSGAIGLLYDEGKIRLDDPVHIYFPEYPAETLHPYTREATIRDLLCMASPHITTYSFQREDWVHSFFEAVPERPPGTIFRYDTSATYILNVIVERLTGQPFIEYMKDKMLREVGFSENAWCVKAPDGYSWGGSGLFFTTRDLARYAYIFLKEGNVDGKQLLSAAYIREATGNQISTYPSRKQPGTYGYGYQIWRYRDNAFAFRGLGGQLAICYPEEDFLFVCTGYSQDIPYYAKLIFDTVHTEIVENLSDTPLPENKPLQEELEQTVANLSMLLPKGEVESPLQQEINGEEYVLEKNDMGIRNMSLSWDGDRGIFRYTNETGEKEIHFGMCRYIEGLFPETHYSGDTVNTPLGRGYKMLAAGAWTDERTLTLRIHLVDNHLGNLTVAFGFYGDKVGVVMDPCAENCLWEYDGRAGGTRRRA